MYEFFRNHALRNVWCNPEQDNQIIVAAKRITPRQGELVSFPIMKRRITLPTANVRYHVFQVGQVHPVILGMLSRTPDWTLPTWKKFSDAVDQLPLYANVYADNGVEIPLHRAYYMYTVDRAFIIAVDEASQSPVRYRLDQIYFRLYTNAYYESSSGASLIYKTKTSGKQILNTNDILVIQTAVAAHKAMPGNVFCFVNGQLTHDINLLNTKVGDIVEYRYDASVKAVYEFQVDTLKTYSSILDDCYKYLIHPPGKTDVIDYIDDVDVYIVSKTGNKFVGQYFHRNVTSSLRMITHRDYGLSVREFEVIASNLASNLSEEPLDIRGFTIQVYVRNSGMVRPLIYDSNRIFELYKLSHEKIEEAMVGVESSMPLWKAENLENSAYTRLMRVNKEAINIELIEDAYGYNSISKIIGDSPIKTVLHAGVRVAELPVMAWMNSTVYEYDADGYLLGFYYHTTGELYHCHDQNARSVEVIYGKGTWEPSIIEGTDLLPVPLDNSYRVYMCYVVDGFPDQKWVDITGTDYYTVENNTILCQGLEQDQWLQVRTDQTFLAYELELDSIAGTFYFDLSEHYNGDHRVMPFPMGDLDIWMNGRSVIEGLGYWVEFPRVYLVCKEFFTGSPESTAQKVTVRFTGFCDKNLKMKPIEDFGFVTHGMLSNDKQFDIRDDKVLRITMRGALKDRSDLIFGELTEGVSVVNPINGSPYQIKDVIVPLDFLAEEETYRLRAEALATDNAVEDYMTLKLPQPSRNAVSAIPNRYILMSPFFSHLANDLAAHQIDRTKLESVLSDNEILEICKPYEKFLEFDPINPENGIEQRFVVIHPTERFTPIGLDLYSYRFMQRVVALYGRNLITLSPHLVINLGG